MSNIAHDETTGTTDAAEPTSETRLKIVTTEADEANRGESYPLGQFDQLLYELEALEEDLDTVSEAVGNVDTTDEDRPRHRRSMSRLASRLGQIREDLGKLRFLMPHSTRIASVLRAAGIDPGNPDKTRSLALTLDLYADLEHRAKTWSPEAIALAWKTDPSDAPPGVWAHRLDAAERALVESRAQEGAKRTSRAKARG